MVVIKFTTVPLKVVFTLEPLLVPHDYQIVFLTPAVTLQPLDQQIDW